MSDQYSLFGGTPPHQKRSDTSREAAIKALPIIRSGHRRVLRALRETAWSGLTDEEIQESTGLNPSTERPRRIELVQLGRVRDSGGRRKFKSGRWGTVWEIVQ